MRFYWLRERKAQGNFDIFWESGKTNKTDYHTKHHSVQHHQDVRHQYVWDGQPPTANHLSHSDTQGCVGVHLRNSGQQITMTSASMTQSGDLDHGMTS